MSLQEKVLRLKLDAVLALRHASFWQKAIDEHGEVKATAFYVHLGLNHLKTKSTYSWEGLTLSREPKEHEKLCIKGIHGAQESGKEQVTKILFAARKELISDGLASIQSLPPAQYHELTLSVSPEIRIGLRDRLIKIHQKGRALVASELSKTKADFDFSDVVDDLDEFVDLTDTRIINEIQARIIAATARNRLTSGLTEAEFWAVVETEVSEQSTAWVERISTGVTNKVLSDGRSAEAQERSDEWKTVEYSAILDQNVCGPCNEDDGLSATNDETDLPDAPNPECEGGDWCRCFHVFITT